MKLDVSVEMPVRLEITDMPPESDQATAEPDVIAVMTVARHFDRTFKRGSQPAIYLLFNSTPSCHAAVTGVYVSSRIYLRKRRVDYSVPYFEVRRSLSLANEIGTEHRTRSIHMVYHT